MVLEKIFKFCQYILLACFFLSSKKDRALHSNKFESFNPRMFPSGSELEHFEISSMFFFLFLFLFWYFSIISLWKIALSLYLWKPAFLLPKFALCQVQLKLDHFFWRRRYFNFVKLYLLFRYYLASEKGVVRHLN